MRTSAKLIMLLLTPLVLLGQTTINGTVTDAKTGDPLIGANVFVDELNYGAATDLQGYYTFEIPVVLVRGQEVEVAVRYIGFRRATLFVTLSPGTITRDFKLQPDVLRLEEVVVTGLARETPLTKTSFDVGRLTADKLDKVPSYSAEEAIRGKVAGARVVQGIGQPGASASILLRGTTSINSSGRTQEPLYIVDGVILSEDGAMADIDALDLESVEVLKGAAASSLYGSRAARGVVQYTTKRGKDLALNKTRIHFRTERGRNELPHKIDMVRYNTVKLAEKSYTDQYGHKVESGDFIDANDNWIDPRDPAGGFEVDEFAPGIQFQDNPHKWVSTGVPGELVDTDGDGEADSWKESIEGPPDLLPKHKDWNGFDHLGRFFKPSDYQTTTISLSRNEASTNFFASFANTQEPGVMYATDGLVRNSLRVNLDHSIARALDLSVSTYYAQSTIDETYSTSGPFFDMTFMPPNVDLLKVDEFDHEREWLQGAWDPKLGKNAEIFVAVDPLNLEEANPLYPLLHQDRERTRNRFLTNARLLYQPRPWVSLESNLSLDRTEHANEVYWPKGFKDPAWGAIAHGRLDRNHNFTEAMNADATASFFRAFGDVALTAKLRYLFEQDRYSGTSGSGRYFAVGGVPSLSVADITKSSMGSSQEKVVAEGYYFIGGADYAGKYITDFLVRRDGVSLFGEDDRWKNYYRVSGAYRISEEPFWSPLKGVFNEFKLRFSQGTAGSRPSFASQYETFSVSGGVVSKGNLGNRKLIPEHQTETEIGLDFALFDRYSIRLTRASSVIKNQLLLAPLTGYYGYSNQWQNPGTLESKTWELTVDAMLMQTKDISWSAGLVYDATEEEITKFTLPAYKSGNYSLFYYREGEKIGTMYGSRWMTGKSELDDYFTNVPGNEFQINDDGYLVWVGAGNAYTDGISKSLWGTDTTFTFKNPDGEDETASFGWGMPIEYLDKEGKDFNKIGMSIPDFNFGFSTDFRFRNFSIYLLFEGQKGGDIYYATGQWGMREQKVAEVDQYGKPEGKKKPTLYYDKLYFVNATNSHFIHDGTYMKLRELSIRYNLSLMGTRVTVGVIGRNLLTWTDYPGYDPEVGRAGGDQGSAVLERFDGWSYPNFRSYALVFEVQI